MADSRSSWRWFPQFLGLDSESAHLRLVGLSILVGIVAGLAAVLFSVACRVAEHYALGMMVGYHATEPHGEVVLPWLHALNTPLRPWMLLVVPTLGGLICGIIVYAFAPEAEGHGTDSVISAYHHQTAIRPRVPLVKIIASAITLGTGGSGGREGPIAQVGAGFGSLLAAALGLTATDRRVLVAAGMGAGIAAIFRAPLAGALFAAEVLYRSEDFESDVILPAGIGSVVAYCTFGSFFGWEPLFATTPAPFRDPLQLLPYTVLAAFMVILAMIYTRTFYGLNHLFRRLRFPAFVKPAIGALLTGCVGLLILHLADGRMQVLDVLSFGYGVLQGAMSQDAAMTAGVLIAVALGKILTTSLTIGSGGSGGVFGPSMVIGGCGGGALGLWYQQLAPAIAPPPHAFVIVGMAGFFSAAAKTPFSTMVMVSEITGDYTLLLPALWVCTLAFLFSDEQSIYSQQVESRAQSPAHQAL